MSSLLVQDYLRGYDEPIQGLEALKGHFGIEYKYSTRHPTLVLLKYNQIESPMGSPLVQECRGLILDSKDNWKIVAFPFTKFFNYGEGHAAKIDWSKARVQEKLDGSLMTLYAYGNEWNVATSGNPDAAGEVNGFGFTFRDLFWKTWDAQSLPLDMLDEESTYMFELTGPFNKVVVPHTETRLTMIGMRVLNYPYYGDPGEEDDIRHCKGTFPVVREFPLTSFAEIEESFKHIDGVRQEGYVVVDANFNRVKVKHPQYVALHHLKDSLGGGNKSMVRILQSNEGSEFLTYYPEFRPMYDEVKAKFDAWVDGMDEVYDILYEQCNGHKGKVNRKDFALQATKTKIPGYMFARLDGKIGNVRDYVKDMPIDSVMKALKLKE